MTCEWEVISKYLSKLQSIVICILQRTLRNALNSLSYFPWKNPISKFIEQLSFPGLEPLSDKSNMEKLTQKQIQLQPQYWLFLV